MLYFLGFYSAVKLILFCVTLETTSGIVITFLLLRLYGASSTLLAFKFMSFIAGLLK